MTNAELKKYARDNGVRQYEIADALEMNESVLSRMYRYELDVEIQDAIKGIIDKIAKSKTDTDAVPKKASVSKIMRERILQSSQKQNDMKEQKTQAVKEAKSVPKMNMDLFDNDMFKDMLQDNQ